MRKPNKLQSTVQCPYCEGCGEIENPVWRGRQMRNQREGASKTITDVAAAMKFSKGYLSDLELGRRAWNIDLIDSYEKALRNGAKK